jgi:Family of unknown function (DUF6464)
LPTLLLYLSMSDRQKLFLTWVFDTAGIIFLLSVYPYWLIIVIICLGIGALIITVQEWWQYKFRSSKHPFISTPELLINGSQQRANYLGMTELDELDLDLFDGNIGDPTCRYNAHSSYLRCAVNPHLNTCEECQNYDPIT